MSYISSEQAEYFMDRDIQAKRDQKDAEAERDQKDAQKPASDQCAEEVKAAEERGLRKGLNRKIVTRQLQEGGRRSRRVSKKGGRKSRRKSSSKRGGRKSRRL